MKRFVFLLILFPLALCAQAQDKLSWGVSAGVQYGGPVPAKSDPDSSGGRAMLGPMAGISVNYQLAEKWRLSGGLGYAMKGATYWQDLRRDTMMPLEILPGVTDTVPTYYVAQVEGQMRLHYLEIPLSIQYALGKRAWVAGGVYGGVLLAGKDVGTSQIQIGDGTLFPDTTLVFDNFPEMNRLDLGFSLGGLYAFDSGLFIEMKAQRSIRGLYRKGFLSSQGLDEIPLYHTQFCLSLGWRF